MIEGTHRLTEREPCGVAFGPAVHVPTDAAAAAWIAPRLGTFGTVGGIVPGGYDAYLLLDFRIEDELGWDGTSRLFGQLVPSLTRHTSTPEDCWFAVWEGYGFGTSMTMLAVHPDDDHDPALLEREQRRLREEDRRRHEEARAALSTVPMFDLPHRRYYLVQGAVGAAAEMQAPDGLFPQPPDLWWPDDRQWFVGGDTDLDWCFVAGPRALIADLRSLIPDSTLPVDWTETNLAAGKRATAPDASRHPGR